MSWLRAYDHMLKKSYEDIEKLYIKGGHLDVLKPSLAMNPLRYELTCHVALSLTW